MRRYVIELKDAEFFARHGCFEEEKIVGNRFIVNLSVEGDFSVAAKSDDLCHALNYQTLYDVVKEQMAIPSNLLEHVGGRIMDAIEKRFPQIEKIRITIDKLNPPLGGKLYASSVTLVR